MVDDLSKQLKVECSDLMIASHLVQRFSEPPEHTDDRVLKYSLAKWSLMLGLEACKPKTELELEDWADLAGQKCEINQPSLQTLIGVTLMTASPEVKAVLRSLKPTTFEGMVNEMALQMFQGEIAVQTLEKELFAPKRSETVMLAKDYLLRTVARYLRVCKRRKWDVSISNQRFRKTVLATVPSVVENAFVLQRGKWNVKPDELLIVLTECELALLSVTGVLPEPQTHAFPVEDDMDEPMDSDDEPLVSQKRIRVKTETEQPRRGYRECKGCGSKAHPYKQCKMRIYRCYKCNHIGHISKVCPSFVRKDAQGRVKVITTPMPSGVTHKVAQDRTAADKVETVSSTMKQFKDRLLQTAAKAQERRLAKKPVGQVAKRIDHPVGLAMSDDINGTHLNDGDIVEMMSALEELDWCFMVQQPNIVNIPLSINHCDVSAMADTGSFYNLISIQQAKQIGLEFEIEKKKFVGVGSAEGIKTKPVVAVFKSGVNVNISFYAVETTIPIVIGLGTLRELNATVDCATGLVKMNEAVLSLMINDVVRVQEIQEKVPKVVAYKGENDDTKETRLATFQCGIPTQRDEIVSILRAREQCWVTPQIGQCSMLERTLVVTGKPYKAPIIPLSEEKRLEMRRQIETLLARGVIVPSKSSWAAAAFFVSKKTGDWRMVMDYRPVNRQMVPDSYPLPLLWHTVQRMAGKRYYSSIDLAAGFWNCPISEESRQYTSFICEMGQFEYTVLPFGIKNSPAEIQRAVDHAFKELLATGKVFVYIDDIGIATDTVDEHLMLLMRVLDKCIDCGLSIQLMKCCFLCQKLVYLGFEVSEAGITPDMKRIEALLNMKSPTNKKELQRALGAVGYVRQFVPDFASKLHELTKMTSKKVKFKWSDACESAFRQVLDEIAICVLLSTPTSEGQYVMLTDASEVGLGVVLLQYQCKDDFVVVEFASRKLSDAERKWTARDREATAIKFGCKRFHNYIDGKRTLVVTDCQSLTFMKDADGGRVHRLWLYLQRYDLHIVHWNGKFNVLADWMSRDVGLTMEEDREVDEMSLAMVATSRDLPWKGILPVKCRLPKVSELMEAYAEVSDAEKRECYVAPDGLLYSVRTHKLFIPMQFRSAVAYWFHAGRYGGHYGVNGTWRRMKHVLWWPKMRAFVSDYIAGCIVCARFRLITGRSLRGVLEKPMLFQLVSLDYIGAITWIGDDYHILVIIDHASRYMVSEVVLGRPTANQTADIMAKKWIAYFGVPEAMLCDRGSEFIGSAFRQWVLNVLDTRIIFNSPAYPQANGINERSHATLMHTVKVRVSIEPGATLVELVRDATLVFNAMPKVSTCQSPMFVLSGQELRLPGLGAFMSDRTEETRIQTVVEMRMRGMMAAQVKDDEYDVSGHNISEGDVVIRQLTDYERGIGTGSTPSTAMKFVPKWSMSSKVTRVMSSVAIVKGLWDAANAEGVQVPLTRLRKLKTEIPVPLRAEMLRSLNQEVPRWRKMTREQWAEFSKNVAISDANVTAVSGGKSPKILKCVTHEESEPRKE